jgi:hypothetical protein
MATIPAIATERCLGDLADAGERAEHVHGFDRQHQHFLVGRLCKLAESLEIFFGDEVGSVFSYETFSRERIRIKGGTPFCRGVSKSAVD